MNKGNENEANFLKFPRFYIGARSEACISKTLPYGIAIMVLNVLVYNFEAKKTLEKKFEQFE